MPFLSLRLLGVRPAVPWAPCLSSSVGFPLLLGCDSWVHAGIPKPSEALLGNCSALGRATITAGLIPSPVSFSSITAKIRLPHPLLFASPSYSPIFLNHPAHITAATRLQSPAQQVFDHISNNTFFIIVWEFFFFNVSLHTTMIYISLESFHVFITVATYLLYTVG